MGKSNHDDYWGLLVPADMQTAPAWLRLLVCNGTGAKGTPKWLVKILDSFGGVGIDFRKASDIHDWMYCFGKTWWEKIWADDVFFFNMFLISFYEIWHLRLSEFVGNLFAFPFRIIRAYFYFLAVLIFGWIPFYKR